MIDRHAQDLLSLSPDLFAVLDTELRLTDLNEAWHRTLGVATEGLLHQSMPDLFHSDDRQSVRTACLTAQGATPNGIAEPSVVSARLVMAAGTERRLQLRIASTEEGYLVHGQDVTVAYDNGRQHRRLTEQQRELLDSIPDMIFYKGLDGRYIGCNRAFATYLGLPVSAVEGAREEDLFDAAHVVDFRATDRSVLTENRSVRRRYEVSASGEPRIHETLKAPFHDQEGRVIGVLGITRDVTDAYRAEQLLRESTEREHLVVETLDLGIWEYEVASEELTWNPRTFELFGRDESEGPFPFAQWADTVLCHDYQTRSAGRQTIEQEVAALLPDGRFRYMRSAAMLLADERGTLVRIVGALVDITDRKLAEESLEEAMIESQRLELEAKRANSAKSDFLASVSHEIRTPMNGVVGIAELLLRTEQNSDRRHYLEMIVRSSEALLELINDLLDLAKVEAGKLELEHATFSLRPLVEDVAELLRVRCADAVEVRVEIGEDVPLLCVGDAARIRQILLNLGGNAVKFTHEGTVTLAVQLLDDDCDEWRIAMSVADTGIGMTAETLKRIFDPFEQADLTTARSYGGTGLGLSISLRLAEAMGGSVRATSEPGVGSTFTAEILLAQPAVGAEPAGLSDDRAEPGRATVGRSYRILVAEDNRTNQYVAKRMLEALGHRVSVVADGAAALDRARRERFDVILCDIQMPVMDGLEFARRYLESADPQARTPIVALSAHAGERERARTVEAGMEGYISKPLRIDELSRVLARVAGTAGDHEPPVASEVQETEEAVDRAMLNDRMMHSTELIRELVGIFLDDVPATLEEFERALRSEDTETAARSAHKIKGAAANLCAQALRTIAGEQERELRAGASDDIDGRVEAMRSTVEETVRAMEMLLADLPGDSR